MMSIHIFQVSCRLSPVLCSPSLVLLHLLFLKFFTCLLSHPFFPAVFILMQLYYLYCTDEGHRIVTETFDTNLNLVVIRLVRERNKSHNIDNCLGVPVMTRYDKICKYVAAFVVLNDMYVKTQLCQYFNLQYCNLHFTIVAIVTDIRTNRMLYIWFIIIPQ